MRSEVLKGHVEFMLLATIDREPKHGYAIVKAIRSASGGAIDLAEGTVYPALYRLERAGFLTSTARKVRGRRRRIYRLTRRGRGALGEQRALWRMFSRAVEAVTG